MLITASNESHGGATAVRGEVKQDTFGVLHRPIMFAGSDGGGFLVSQRYSALEGYYRFLPTTLDACIISVAMFKQGEQIGFGSFYADTPAEEYTRFTASITYSSNETPDWATIDIRTFCCGLASGTVFYVDDLSFANPTAVAEEVGSLPTSYKLEQNFPNPFNPKTKIGFTLPARTTQAGGQVSGFTSLKIYNILGVEVATLVNENLDAGSYTVEWDGSGQPSGTYYYQLKTEDFTATKKFTVIR
jgi:hypothetical protein